MAPVPRKEGFVSSPTRGPGLRHGPGTRTLWPQQDLGKAALFVLRGTTVASWPRPHRMWLLVKWTGPQAETRQTVGIPGPPRYSLAPGPSHHCGLPTPTHFKAVAQGVRTQWASGIKAPEERGHGHHEQGVEVDDAGPVWVLTDVLQPPGCGICLLLGRAWGAARPTPAHTTEPEQALPKQAWPWGRGRWEKLRPKSESEDTRLPQLPGPKSRGQCLTLHLHCVLRAPVLHGGCGWTF